MARRSQKTIAVENMKYPSTQHVLVKLFGKEVRKEVRSMASVISIKPVKDDLKNFQWDRLHAELSLKAPLLLNILFDATKTRVPRPNSHIVIGICCNSSETSQSKNEFAKEDYFSCVVRWSCLKTGA